MSKIRNFAIFFCKNIFPGDTEMITSHFLNKA